MGRAAKIAAVLLEISISELNELQTAQQQNLPTLSQAQGREAASAEGTSLEMYPYFGITKILLLFSVILLSINHYYQTSV